MDINGIMKNKITKKSTIRDVMQVLGTDLLRQGFNNNIHVAATLGSIKENEKVIITDLRFPNEVKAVKDRGGITIRINRPDFVENALTGEKFPVKVYKQEHESETALDNYKFDYEIQNDGTIAELIDKVEVILKQEKII